jgi:hypothetical protein
MQRSGAPPRLWHRGPPGRSTQEPGKQLVPMRTAGRAQRPVSPEEGMMNNSRVLRRPRRAGPRTARAAAAIIATAGLALLAAACSSPSSAGSGGSPDAGGPSTSPSTHAEMVLAFSGCMRSHGVPDFPDPDSSGVLPKREVAQLIASNPQFPAAHRACEHMLPDGGQPTRAQMQQAWNDMRNFAAACAPTGCRTGPTPPPRPSRTSDPSFTCRTAWTRMRRTSLARSAHASTLSMRTTRL